MNNNYIVYNAIKTPDGTVLESKHTHDYNTYKDKNGLVYMVDGGLSYLRRSCHKDHPYTELSVYSDDPHDEIREVFMWTSYGKDGKSKPIRQPIKDLSDDHIQNIILNIRHLPEQLMNIFYNERDYREKINV